MMLLLSQDDLREDRRHVAFEQVEYEDFNTVAQFGLSAIQQAIYAEKGEGAFPKFKKILSPQKIKSEK